MRTVVIYHRADFDGIFCREIAKRFLPHAELIGWDYGDPEPCKDLTAEDELYILDLSVPSLMDHPKLIWIDHHKSAIEKYPASIKGYRIDGVAACRLAWQWFTKHEALFHPTGGSFAVPLPCKEEYMDRAVNEPMAVRLAGEYDIWDRRDPDAELFQHGLRSQELNEATWQALLCPAYLCGCEKVIQALLDQGRAIQYAKTQENESIIKSNGFTVRFEGLTFLACNAARFNSHLFTAGLQPEHDGCLGFNWDGKSWKVSLYGVPGKPDIDLSAIAVQYGGGGHKQACGFKCITLPFFF
jgi:hypothetical protein